MNNNALISCDANLAYQQLHYCKIFTQKLAITTSSNIYYKNKFMWYLHFVGVSGFFITTTINLHITFNTNTFYIWLFCNFDLSNINTSPLLRLKNSKRNWKIHCYCIRNCLLATKHIIVLFSCPKITQLPILLNWFVCFSLFYRHYFGICTKWQTNST